MQNKTKFWIIFKFRMGSSCQFIWHSRLHYRVSSDQWWHSPRIYIKACTIIRTRSQWPLRVHLTKSIAAPGTGGRWLVMRSFLPLPTKWTSTDTIIICSLLVKTAATYPSSVLWFALPLCVLYLAYWQPVLSYFWNSCNNSDTIFIHKYDCTRCMYKCLNECISLRRIYAFIHLYAYMLAGVQSTGTDTNELEIVFGSMKSNSSRNEDFRTGVNLKLMAHSLTANLLGN